MVVRNIDRNAIGLNEDWEGNNAAFSCLREGLNGLRESFLSALGAKGHAARYEYRDHFGHVRPWS
jgi:hypothetical protein